jgi:CubicO group peptidase (beta-lactamase class C family)
MRNDRGVVFALSIASCVTLAAQPAARYYPPAGQWAKKSPAEVGMDAAKLTAAVEFAKARETNWPRDYSTQEKIFGSLLGPIPKSRAATSGVVIRNGYVVAEFGNTSAADPRYSVAKSMLSTVAGIAVREGLIESLDAPVGSQIKDGGYDSLQNAQITWRHHLAATSQGQ